MKGRSLKPVVGTAIVINTEIQKNDIHGETPTFPLGIHYLRPLHLSTNLNSGYYDRNNIESCCGVPGVLRNDKYLKTYPLRRRTALNRVNGT